MFKIITIEALLNMLEKYNFKEFHIHHTWKPNHASFNGSNGIELQKSMENYHVNTKGWSCIGQHVTLLPNGLFVTGRNFKKNPASILGHNSKAFALEMIGNFDIGYDELSGSQKESLLKLINYFSKKGKYIRFHRENAKKTCPGTSLDKKQLIAEAKGVIAPPPVKSGSDWIRQAQDLCNESFNANLKVDGLWGTNTAAAMPLIKKHSNLKYFVSLIQKALLARGYKLPKYGNDKDFGTETATAIELFQANNRLVSDGIVGKNTWKELLK